LNNFEEKIARDIGVVWDVDRGEIDARRAVYAWNRLVDGSMGAHPMENMLDE
jgi:nitrous oxide reductase accessory protein NosL